MTYYFDKLHGFVYSNNELVGAKKILLKYDFIEPITDYSGKNYCILVNPQNKKCKVVKKENRGYDHKKVIREYKKNGYQVVKEFDKDEVKNIKTT